MLCGTGTTAPRVLCVVGTRVVEYGEHGAYHGGCPWYGSGYHLLPGPNTKFGKIKGKPLKTVFSQNFRNFSEKSIISQNFRNFSEKSIILGISQNFRNFSEKSILV